MSMNPVAHRPAKHHRNLLAYSVLCVLTGAWAISYPFIHLGVRHALFSGSFGIPDIIAIMIIQTVPAAALVGFMWTVEHRRLRQ